MDDVSQVAAGPDQSSLMPPLNPFKGTGLGLVMDGFFAVFEQTGFADVIGGPEVLKEGMNDLLLGALPLAGELVQAERRQVSLADAVYDPDNWPHLALVHGFIVNLLTMNVPEELIPWASRLASMVPPPEIGALHHTLVATAVQDPNPIARALSRFIVFESVCLIQRLALLHDGVHVEAVGGRRRDVETVAETELRFLENADVYQAELLALEDPLQLLNMCGLVSLTRHLEVLKDELAFVSKEINEQLARRQRLLAIADRLDPKDRIVLLNGVADTFGEESVASHQLRRLNSGHLDGLSDEAIWKRKSRLPEKVKGLNLDEDGYPEPMGDAKTSKSMTFADLILQAADSQETNR